ncbi:MAG TPA: hypothetical protein VKB38_07920 [Terracidiphilus sp.]|nr:hypothetical protein [Terracidiphilus sp.]
MRRKWIFFVAPPAAVLFIFLFGELVKYLWNWLAPALFGWHTIGFWQALGLLLLCRILFGSWGGGGQDRKARHHKGAQWVCLTPEEREQLRQGSHVSTGGYAGPASQPGAPA